MDTDRLKYFCAVVDTGSASKASQLLGISHSGISKSISVLEAETGRKVFRPLGRGLELTAEGRWVYARAKRLLEIAHELRSSTETKVSTVKITLSEAFAISSAGHIATALSERVEFVEAVYSQIEEKILSGEAHFGVCFVPSPHPSLEYLEIGDVVFNAHAREDLLRAVHADEIPFAVNGVDFPANVLELNTRDTWPAELARKIFYSVTSFSIALAILKEGRAAVYMPDFIALNENLQRVDGLKIKKIAAHSSAENRRKLFLVKEKTCEETSSMKKVVRVLRMLCCESR